MTLNRRRFLKGTLAAAASITIAGTKSSGRVLGANEAIRVGVAGLNGRGGEHVSQFLRMEGVQITYLIDPDSRTFASKSRQIQQRSGNAPRTVADVRTALEDRNLDVLSIATPNHWHSLMTIWACQAGKDVYVEKPMSHNVREGRIAADMARRHNRIVQHGTQSRTEGGWSNVIDVIRSGQLGRLLVARGLCYKSRYGTGSNGVVASVRRVDTPQQLDFNIWTGPAPMRSYHENLVPYRWHWFWDFGNGDIGNQGVHQMDIARWAIAGATLPRSVICLGGRFGNRDHGETPNTQVAFMDYGPTKLIFEVRGMPTPGYRNQMVGNTFHLEEGTIVGTNAFYRRGRDRAEQLPRVQASRRGPATNHFANFIAAVRSRQQSDLNANILEGHYSSALCHLANISYRLGTSVPFNPRNRTFVANPDATDALQRMEDHLGMNEVNLQTTMVRVGPLLTLDARNETFVDNAEANRLLTRENRRPFVVSNG
jgi:predicted dehydrogenase